MLCAMVSYVNCVRLVNLTQLCKNCESQTCTAETNNTLHANLKKKQNIINIIHHD